jgi:hypothetical protein
VSAAAGYPHQPDPGNDEAPPGERQGFESLQTPGQGLRSKSTTARRCIATLSARFDGREPWPSADEAERELARSVRPIDEASRQQLVGLRRHATRPDTGVRIATALERIAAALESRGAQP